MTSLYVIPTQAGIQITYWYNNTFMDFCFHGNDIFELYHGKIYSRKKFGTQVKLNKDNTLTLQKDNTLTLQWEQ